MAVNLESRYACRAIRELRQRWNYNRIGSKSDRRSSPASNCAIGTVSADGYPHVTPIGFIFLRDDYTAYYFEEYTKKIPANIQHNPRVCLMVVNSSSLLWVTSLFKGKFASPPGIRLFGIAGDADLLPRIAWEYTLGWPAADSWQH